MIIHKPIEKKQPHEGIEYFHKSKEPETIQECSLLHCWHCVHNSFLGIDACKHRQKLRKEMIHI